MAHKAKHLNNGQIQIPFGIATSLFFEWCTGRLIMFEVTQRIDISAFEVAFLVRMENVKPDLKEKLVNYINSNL